jgi:hypothetical protein
MVWNERVTCEQPLEHGNAAKTLRSLPGNVPTVVVHKHLDSLEVRLVTDVTGTSRHQTGASLVSHCAVSNLNCHGIATQHFFCV